MFDEGLNQNMSEVKTSFQNKKLLTISSSPHLLNSDSTKSIMWTVVIFLLPATFFGIYAFGLYSAFIVLTSIIASIVCDIICLLLRKRKIQIQDGSAFLTGLLIGMNMPPSIPLYIPIATSIFAVCLVKHAFGGLGQNWANPAIAGRVFALIAWSKHMTTWKSPFSTPFFHSLFTDSISSASAKADALTTATPLGALKSAIMDGGIDFSGQLAGQKGIASIFFGPIQLLQSLPTDIIQTETSYFNLFFGVKGGSIGEISIFLLLLGGIYLIYRKIILPDIPFSFLATVCLIAWIFDGNRFGLGLFHGDPIFHLLTGGVVLGALFMATDLVTTPITIKGRLLFGVGCGVITMLVRMYGGLPEGVSLSILFMNMLTPAIDRFIKIKPLGFVKEKKV